MSYWRGTWAAIFLATLIWSGINPKDTVTWMLEVLPAVVGAVILFWTRDRFPLTTLTYVLVLIHCVILMVGGHYTYAEVPIGDLFNQWFDHGRNNYDKLGHLAQGFVPAIIARELSIRLGIFRSKAWMNFFIVAMCLGISALYEIIEWLVALISEQAAEAFLGMQGYVWDTQSDMALALVGAVAALLLLGRWHDRQLQRLVANA